MSTTPNFETSYSHTIRSVFLRAFHKCDHCPDRMSNGGDIRKKRADRDKKSYGFDFGGDFCSYVHKNDYVTDLPSFFNYPLMIGSTLFTVNYRGSLEKLHTVDRRRSFTAIDLYRIYELFGLLESCR